MKAFGFCFGLMLAFSQNLSADTYVLAARGFGEGQTIKANCEFASNDVKAKITNKAITG